ncbi:MAG: ATP-binding cassette domain-containing protein [Ancrocorticia sp.]|uniref:ATP-binding cassette domain-containing protein n=1 Tax=Ancrocorticia sp. TaxID=2593684 RepID=UPI003F9333CA
MQLFDKYPTWLWALRFGFHASPWSAIPSTILMVLAALIPAINVLLVRQLAEGLALDDSILPLILIAGLVFGAGGALQQITFAVSRIHAVRMVTIASEYFDKTLACSDARDYSSSDFMRRVRNARQGITEGHVSSQFQATVNILCALITAASLASALWDLSAKAALVSLLAPIPTMIAYAWYGRKESHYWPKASEQSRRATYLQDQIAYQRTGTELSSLDASGEIAKLASSHRRNHLRIRQRLEGMAVCSDSASGIVTMFLFCGALIFLYQDSVHETGAIYARIIGLMSGIGAMSGIGYQIGELVTSMPANSRLRTFLNSGKKDKRLLPIERVGTLSGSDICVHYGDLCAVNNVSMTAYSSGLCALVGENGSGKTSLIKAIMNIQDCATGCIYLDQTQINLEKDTDVSFPFAMVQQDYGRYEITVREFVTLGSVRHPLTDAMLWEALACAEARDFVEELPDGLDTLLGVQWGGVDVSGGQWQRLAIARAFLSDAPVWFLDEPTSAIDAPTEQKIFDRLAQEANNRFIILSSHRVSTLRSAQQIFVLQKERIAESGSYPELLAEGTEFRHMFESQLKAD